MMKNFLLLILLLFLTVVTALEPVTLFLSSPYNVKLLVGNPSLQITFALDLNSSDIVLPATLVQEKSQTYSDTSEIFYIRHLKLRFPVFWDFSLSSRTGSIGLGSESYIWKYWNEFSLSPSHLALGFYDRFSQQNLDFIAPNLTGYDQVTALLLSPSPLDSYNVTFSSTTPDTFLPTPLYIRENISLHFSGWVWKITSRDYIGDDDLKDVKLIQRLTTSSNKIVIGQHLLQRLLIWKSPALQKTAISLNYRHFNREEKQYNTISLTILVFVLIFWLSFVLSEEDKSFRAARLINLLRLYGHVLSLSVLLINTLKFQLHTNLHFYFQMRVEWFIVILYIIFILFAIWSLFVTVKTSSILLARILFEVPVLLAIWITLLQTHEFTFDFIFILFVSTVLSILLTTVTFEALFHLYTSPLSFQIVCFSIFITILSYVFLLIFNVQRAIFIVWGKHPVSWAISLFYLVSIVIAIPLIIFTRRQIAFLAAGGGGGDDSWQ